MYGSEKVNHRLHLPPYASLSVNFLPLVQPVLRTEKCLHICGADVRCDLILQSNFSHIKWWVASAKHKFR